MLGGGFDDDDDDVHRGSTIIGGGKQPPTVNHQSLTFSLPDWVGDLIPANIDQKTNNVDMRVMMFKVCKVVSFGMV